MSNCQCKSNKPIQPPKQYGFIPIYDKADKEYFLPKQQTDQICFDWGGDLVYSEWMQPDTTNYFVKDYAFYRRPIKFDNSEWKLIDENEEIQNGDQASFDGKTWEEIKPNKLTARLMNESIDLAKNFPADMKIVGIRRRIKEFAPKEFIPEKKYGFISITPNGINWFPSTVLSTEKTVRQFNPVVPDKTYGYILIKTKEEKEKYSPRRKGDEFWDRDSESWHYINDNYSHFTGEIYRRKVDVGTDCELLKEDETPKTGDQVTEDGITWNIVKNSWSPYTVKSWNEYLKVSVTKHLGIFIAVRRKKPEFFTIKNPDVIFTSSVIFSDAAVKFNGVWIDAKVEKPELYKTIHTYIYDTNTDTGIIEDDDNIYWSNCGWKQIKSGAIDPFKVTHWLKEYGLPPVPKN